jgi:hypothetical protein
MNFLFRRPLNGHTFMTTQDPSYIYEVLCGRCDYPIEADDERCPRCQVLLEDCPVCRDITHKRAPVMARDAKTGGKTCPVCDTRRYQFGKQSLREIEGTFCTNLYGCPAGGLLLRTEEFAVLRPESSRCPVCKHESLKPLDLRTFIYLISQCVFCNSAFGIPSSWAPGEWARNWDVTTDRLRSTPHRDYHPCPLCGREDTLMGRSSSQPFDETSEVKLRDKPSEPSDRELQVEMLIGDLGEEAGAKKELSSGLYARVVELGKILIFENDDRRASKRLYSTWFDALHLASGGDSIQVQQAGDYLLQGTRKTEIYKILRVRLEALLYSWKQQVPGQGLGYFMSPRGHGKK